MLIGTAAAPAPATADVLQCVPYARALSGIAIRGDAWTWWQQADGRYVRGQAPRAGAVLALAATAAMPLGHVAVVSRVLDERRILLRHANWSGPGVIEEDVMAVDSSDTNDWSQVRIWWGQTQRMGARDNPVNGFIYPDRIGPRTVYAAAETKPVMALAVSMPANATASAAKIGQRLRVDPAVFRATFDDSVAAGDRPRSLADIVADIRASDSAARRLSL